MSKIVLVRHGSTKWNDRKRIQGRSSLPLTVKGRDQVSALVPILKGSDTRIVISSPTTRAYQSAKIIADALGLELVLDDDFVELDVGEWHGKTEDELSRMPSWKTYRSDPDVAKPEGGESLAHLRKRVLHGLHNIMQRSEATKVIVTHGDVIRTIICHLTGRPFREMHRIEVPLASAITLDLNDTNSRNGLI